MAWKDAITGGLGGAGSGAMIGSMIAPGIGTGIGAGLGGLLGLFGGAFGEGDPEEFKQMELYTPEQRAMMSQLGQMGMGGLQDILSKPLDSGAMEADVMRQYQQQIIPGLMHMLGGAGPTAGLQRSSAIGGQLGAAGSDLATRLASLRSQMAQQQQGLRANIYGGMLGHGLQKTYEPMYRPQGPGLAETLMPAIGQGLGGLGQGFGQYLGSDWAAKRAAAAAGKSGSGI